MVDYQPRVEYGHNGRVLRLTVREFLDAHGLSAYKLARKIREVRGDQKKPTDAAVYAFVNGTNAPSWDMLNDCIAALRGMTGRDVHPAEVLEWKEQA